MTSSLCVLMFLSLCGTVCSPYSCHHPDTFSEVLQCFCSRKTFQTFHQTSSVLPYGRCCIHASLTSWPRRIWPLTSVLVCVWQVSEGDAERVCEPWFGDPTRALVTGVMGLLLPPVRLSVHPAASRGPRVLRSLRFQPSPENSTAGKHSFFGTDFILWIRIHFGFIVK